MRMGKPEPRAIVWYTRDASLYGDAVLPGDLPDGAGTNVVGGSIRCPVLVCAKTIAKAGPLATPLIAFISHDQRALATMRAMLSAAGYRVTGLLAAETTLAEIRVARPALIVLDVPTDDRAYAWELIARIHAECATARVPLIVCSEDIFFLRKEAGHLAVYDYSVLPKPYTREALLGRIADRFVREEDDGDRPGSARAVVGSARA